MAAAADPAEAAAPELYRVSLGGHGTPELRQRTNATSEDLAAGVPIS